MTMLQAPRPIKLIEWLEKIEFINDDSESIMILQKVALLLPRNALWEYAPWQRIAAKWLQLNCSNKRFRPINFGSYVLLRDTFL